MSKFQEVSQNGAKNYRNSCLDRSVNLVDIDLDEGQIQIFPNPTGYVFEIEGLLRDYNIEILDATGSVYKIFQSVG